MFVLVAGGNLPSDIASGGLQICAVEVCHASMTRSSQHTEGVQRKNAKAFLNL